MDIPDNSAPTNEEAKSGPDRVREAIENDRGGKYAPQKAIRFAGGDN